MTPAATAVSHVGGRVRLNRVKNTVAWVGIGLTVIVGGIVGSPAVASADPKKVAYGKHLASECTSCHRIDGVDNGIPSITGWDVAEFVQTMAWYKEGTRDNQAMRSVADSLDEDQIAALATYFNTIPKPPKKK
jgi:cytochrome c